MNLVLEQKAWGKNGEAERPKGRYELLWASWKLEPSVKADWNWWGTKYFCTHIKESVKGLVPGMSSCQLGLNFPALVLSDLVFN